MTKEIFSPIVDGDYIAMPGLEMIHNSAYTDISMIWSCCSMEVLGILMNNMFGTEPLVPPEKWITGRKVQNIYLMYSYTLRINSSFHC